MVSPWILASVHAKGSLRRSTTALDADSPAEVGSERPLEPETPQKENCR